MPRFPLQQAPVTGAVFFDANVWLYYLADLLWRPFGYQSLVPAYFTYFNGAAIRVAINNTLISEIERNYYENVTKGFPDNNPYADLNVLWDELARLSMNGLLVTLPDASAKVEPSLLFHYVRSLNLYSCGRRDWGNMCHFMFCATHELPLITHDRGFAAITRALDDFTPVNVYSALGNFS